MGCFTYLVFLASIFMLTGGNWLYALALFGLAVLLSTLVRG